MFNILIINIFFLINKINYRNIEMKWIFGYCKADSLVIVL